MSKKKCIFAPYFYRQYPEQDIYSMDYIKYTNNIIASGTVEDGQFMRVYRNKRDEWYCDIQNLVFMSKTDYQKNSHSFESVPMETIIFAKELDCSAIQGNINIICEQNKVK